jgi:hypothetical protein
MRLLAVVTARRCMHDLHVSEIGQMSGQIPSPVYKPPRISYNNPNPARGAHWKDTVHTILHTLSIPIYL